MLTFPDIKISFVSIDDKILWHIPLYPTYPTLPHIPRFTPLIMIFRTNPTLPNPSYFTAFMPFYFTHPTLPPYTTLPNLSNSTPLISLYPTQHATISHISHSTSTVLFYRTNTDISQPSYSTSPIPL